MIKVQRVELLKDKTNCVVVPELKAKCNMCFAQIHLYPDSCGVKTHMDTFVVTLVFLFFFFFFT